MSKHRIIPFLLLASMLAASCGGGPTVSDDTVDTSDSQPEETTAATRLTELGSKNFENRKFTIMDANDYPATNIIYPGDSLNGDIINDALYNRNAKIEDLYKIKIEYVHMDPAKTGAEAVRQSVLAGDQAYDLINSTILASTLSPLSTEGILANLADIPYLSLDKPWWSTLMYENLSLNGKIYFTSGDISYRIYLAPHVAYINSVLLDSYNIDTDVYDLVLNGKWTVDELFSMTKQYDQDLDGDGSMNTDNDFFGLVMQDNVLCSNALVVGAGVSLSDVGKDGLTVSLGNENTLNVVEKLKKLAIENYSYANQNDIYQKAFSEDRAIVCIHLMSTVINDKLRNMDSDFLIVPVPKYDEKQESYRSLVNAWNNAFVAIPKNADEEFSGFLTEAMAYESYASVRPKFYELALKEKATRDERAKEMIDIITETAYLDFNAIYDFGSSTTILRNAIWDDRPIASELASAKSVIESSIATFTANWDQE